MTYHIKYTQDAPPDVSKRAWTKIQRNSNYDVGAYWHEKYFPEHFKPSAAQRYSHKARSEGYIKRKRRLAEQNRARRVDGQIVDNVLTGRMRAAMMRAKVVKGFPTRTTVTMTGPRYVTLRFKAGSNQPNKAAELTRVVADEAQKLAEVKRDSVLKQLNEIPKRGGKRTKVI